MTYQTCNFCQGRGIVPSVEAASLSFLRQIRMGVSRKGVSHVQGSLSMEVATYIQNKKRRDLAELESRYGVGINLQADPTIPPGNGSLEFLKEDHS